ncbi:Na+/H+ antiporter [Motilibacter aurantiacus]|uniref:Na+/H+ antiporter n=1 Tax=Motilibacter aurantiacus TaxID=2714955 RepID=UPI00140B2085|nr:Na+/H+ antiporter [Motilibacter aurantiacus]NHC44759.1 Na+/H+ antiporter [Motilibacter aurantiacus]
MGAHSDVLLLVVGVAAAYGLARRVGVLPPLLLTVVGVVASYVPGVPEYHLEPEVVLALFLPPLLYAAAISTSLPGFTRNLRPIGLLAVGLVVFTTLAVGFTLHWVLPEIPLAAALALGAVVAPPDAVAATAVARRTGLPRRLVSLLEGESLVNDATALTILSVATAAIADPGTPGPVDVAGEFLVASVGGTAVGVAVAYVVALVRRHVDEPLMSSTLSLLTPFAAWALAEEIHSSGVLAVVVAGLILGHKSPRLLSAEARLQQRAIWETIEFLLQGVLFALVGLQLPLLVEELDEDLPTVLTATAVVVAVVVVARPVWVFPATYLTRLVPRIRHSDPPPTVKFPAVISWAGMRGAVSLAAALSLSEETPHRELLVFVTFVVIAVTLIGQGSTLPLLIRMLRIEGPDPVQDALQEASVKQDAVRAAEEALDRLVAEHPLPHGVEERLRQGADHRAMAAWERLGVGGGSHASGETAAETPSEAYRRVRHAMLVAERDVLVKARDEGRIDHEVMQAVLRDLDLEETLLSGVDERRGGSRQESTVLRNACEHLASAPADTSPSTTQGCEDCLREGTAWVHLRLCLGCGHVGCCDSSPRRHATRHWQADGHPVIRSFEPGEDWRWCYADEVVS